MSNKEGCEFLELLERLKVGDEEWKLPRILLEKCLSHLEGRVTITKLAEVAKEVFFAVHVGKKLQQDDPLFSLEGFKNVALHAVAILQHRLVAAFSAGENPKAYMLLVSPKDVCWGEWREGMEEFIRDQQAQVAG